MWENFDPKKKAEYEKDYKEKMEQFKEDVATWQNKYGHKEKKAKSTGKEISKPEKEKGAKGKNVNEEAKGKKVEESDARKASKSKGKDQGKPGRSKKWLSSSHPYHTNSHISFK